ncbi:histidine kinase, partial [Amphritea sp. 1_MG-2023]|nr:histidine kinase [Amphritea sp. 1_MG-2023]
EDAERSLAHLNAELEQRVSDRTRELEQSNEELRATLEKLQEAQQQLVESKKLAALGGLVAGVAHEINTPIGVGYTAASFLVD